MLLGILGLRTSTLIAINIEDIDLNLRADMDQGKWQAPAEWQADSKISNIISDFILQRMSGGVGGALSDGCPYPYRQIVLLIL